MTSYQPALNNNTFQFTMLGIDVSVVPFQFWVPIFKLNVRVRLISKDLMFQVLIFIHLKIVLLLIGEIVYKKGDSFLTDLALLSTAKKKNILSSKVHHLCSEKSILWNSYFFLSCTIFEWNQCMTESKQTFSWFISTKQLKPSWTNQLWMLKI